MVDKAEENLSLIEKRGFGVENDGLGQGPESFVVQVGVVEEGVSLMENEVGLRVENNDLGQGPESIVVQVGVVEGDLVGRQLSVVVHSVDAGAVAGSGVDVWRGLDGRRELDDWMMQKKVSE